MGKPPSVSVLHTKGRVSSSLDPSGYILNCYLFRFIYFMCRTALPECMSVYVVYAGCQQRSEEGIGCLELELEMAVSCHCVLGIKARSPARAAKGS